MHLHSRASLYPIVHRENTVANTINLNGMEYGLAKMMYGPDRRRTNTRLRGVLFSSRSNRSVTNNNNRPRKSISPILKDPLDRRVMKIKVEMERKIIERRHSPLILITIHVRNLEL